MDKNVLKLFLGVCVCGTNSWLKTGHPSILEVESVSAVTWYLNNKLCCSSLKRARCCSKQVAGRLGNAILPVAAAHIGCVCKFALAIYSDFRALSPECARGQSNWWIYERSTPVEYGVSINIGKKASLNCFHQHSYIHQNVLEWPSQCSELNPIEHLWRDLKIAVQRCSPSNLTELERICREEWEKLPKYRCARCTESL